MAMLNNQRAYSPSTMISYSEYHVLRFDQQYIILEDLQDPIHWRYRFLCLAYFLGLCKGISQQNIALYGTVPPF